MQKWAETSQAYRLIDGDYARGVVILCDHAENALPEEYGQLGLHREELGRHIAYDIGAAGVAERLAAKLGAPAVLSRFSRLLIDPNRGLDDPTLVMRVSDGTLIAGNATIDESEIARRVRRYHAPYHAAIDAAIEKGLAAGKPPVLVSIHSFTQAWKARPRPWHITVLWDHDPRLPAAMLEALRRDPEIVVGENVPYSGKLKGDTLYRHGTERGLAHALVELRQDLILSPDGQEAWAARLADVLLGILSRAELAQRLHAIQHYGSKTDGTARAEPDPGGAEMRQAMDQTLQTELEAAAFRRLVEHLRTRSDVQNIDMMDLAGFCRNCLSNWYREAAAERGVSLSKDEAREIVYGMPYEEWKAKFQTGEQVPTSGRGHG